MIRIACDLDDCIFDFINAYKKIFSGNRNMIDRVITKNVHKLLYNKHFWENLELLEYPDFEPCIYATKRINSKVYTRNCLLKHSLPIKPIYQTLYQKGNKADIIKGRCDVLIDDSYSNVIKAIKSGLPALLIDRPHNRHIDFEFRIYHLKYNEVYKMYMKEIEMLQNGY
jgi:hypothetical protein